MISWPQMPCYHFVPCVSRQDLIEPSSVIASQKNKITSNFSFFSLPPPCFPLHSFFHHQLQTCDRLQTGWEGRTMRCNPRYCPPARRRAPAPAPSPSRPWGGHLPLSTPLRRHPNQLLHDTIQTIQWSPCITVRCTTSNDQPCGSALTERQREQDGELLQENIKLN